MCNDLAFLYKMESLVKGYFGIPNERVEGEV